MFVKPGTCARRGVPLLVRFPRTKRLLASAGQEVPKNFFWIRRLRDGDVVVATPPAAANPSSNRPVSPAPAPATPAVGGNPAPGGLVTPAPVEKKDH